MRNAFAITILMCLLSWPAFSQQGNWDSLSQLKAGNKIHVVETNLKAVDGKFVRITDTDLTVRVDKQEVVIPRDQVYRVSRRGGRGRNALIGLAIGAGAGVIVGVASPELGTGKCAQGSCVDSAVVAGLALAGGGLGAGVGALIPHNPTGYRAAQPPKK